MKAWEILKLLEEGNVLETDDCIMRLHLSADGTLSDIRYESKHDKNDYWFYNLNNFDGNWRIKREPIPFEKAIEYMRNGRICKSGDYKYKISENILYVSSLKDNKIGE